MPAHDARAFATFVRTPHRESTRFIHSRNAARPRNVRGRMCGDVKEARERLLLLQQTRKSAVGEDFSARLTGGTVVGFVVGVADALNFFAASRTRLAKAAVDSHFRPEGCHFFRKVCLCLAAQTIDPELQSLARRGKEPLPFFWF